MDPFSDLRNKIAELLNSDFRNRTVELPKRRYPSRATANGGNRREPSDTSDARLAREKKRLRPRVPSQQRTIIRLDDDSEDSGCDVPIEEKKGPRFRDFGGMDDVLTKLKWELLMPLHHAKSMRTLGIKPPRGILLSGPPGCGKTSLAHALANEAGVSFHKVCSTDILNSHRGVTEGKIRDLFQEARRNAPSIVFIDEIDAIASERGKNVQNCQTVTQLLASMDEYHTPVDAESGHVLVIGATNRPAALDPALRRAGRFDLEIVLRPPDESARTQILSVLTRGRKLEGSVDLLKIARSTPGFVGTDLAALVDRAAKLAHKRVIVQRKRLHQDKGPNESWEHPLSAQEKRPVSAQEMYKCSITMADLEDASKAVQASSLREGFDDIPGVTWEDIGGLDSLRKAFEEDILWPIKYPEYYKEIGLKSEVGFLLFGPPGCGKTLIAQAVANESGANFIYVKGPELLGTYVGQSELAIRTLFKRARTCSPCIIFFDELDALAKPRGTGGPGRSQAYHNIVNQLLTELQDRRPGVFVIGATNRVDSIDSALLRHGRFGKHHYVGPPDQQERLSIMKALGRKRRLDPDVDLNSIAQTCRNFSGADLEALMDRAAKIALKDKLISGGSSSPLIIKTSHFERAAKPSSSEKDAALAQPSLTREGFSEIPNVKWEDVGGLDSLRQAFVDHIIRRIKCPELYEKYGIKSATGFLLVGPPGCGKTLIAKAVASEAGANFIHIKGPELLNKWVGESEAAVRKLFQRARTSSPCIIFFDEVDSLTDAHNGSGPGGRTHKGLLRQLLLELDGGDDRRGVYVIGATNKIEVMDRAILRSGRFEELHYVRLPSPEERVLILKALGRTRPLDPDVDFDYIARLEACENFSGADLARLMDKTAMVALKEESDNIKRRHFESVLSTVSPTVTSKDIQHYDKLAKEFNLQ